MEEKAIELMKELSEDKLEGLLSKTNKQSKDNILKSLYTQFDKEKESLATEIKDEIERIQDEDRTLQRPEVQRIVNEKFEQKKRETIVKIALAKEGRETLQALNKVYRERLAREKSQKEKLEIEIEKIQNEILNYQTIKLQPSTTKELEEGIDEKIKELMRNGKPLIKGREECIRKIGELDKAIKVYENKELSIIKKMIRFDDYFQSITPETFEKLKISSKLPMQKIEDVEQEALAKISEQTIAKSPENQAQNQDTGDKEKGESQGKTPTSEKIKTEETQNNQEDQETHGEQASDNSKSQQEEQEPIAISFGGVRYFDEEQLDGNNTEFDTLIEKTNIKPAEQEESEVQEDAEQPIEEILEEYQEATQMPDEKVIDIIKKSEQRMASNNTRLDDYIMRELTEISKNYESFDENTSSKALFPKEVAENIVDILYRNCGDKADNSVILGIIKQIKSEGKYEGEDSTTIRKKILTGFKEYTSLVLGKMKPEETEVLLPIEYDLTDAEERLSPERFAELKEMAYQSRHFATIVGISPTIELEWKKREAFEKEGYVERIEPEKEAPKQEQKPVPEPTLPDKQQEEQEEYVPVTGIVTFRLPMSEVNRLGPDFRQDQVVEEPKEIDKPEKQEQSAILESPGIGASYVEKKGKNRSKDKEDDEDLEI